MSEYITEAGKKISCSDAVADILKRKPKGSPDRIVNKSSQVEEKKSPAENKPTEEKSKSGIFGKK